MRVSQSFDPRPEVDVKRQVIQNEGGHRFHAFGFRLRDPVLALSQMHDFQIEPLRVERGGDFLFGRHANRAAGVVESGFAFHRGLSSVSQKEAEHAPLRTGEVFGHPIVKPATRVDQRALFGAPVTFR